MQTLFGLVTREKPKECLRGRLLRVGYLNSFLSPGGGNLNSPFSKVQMHGSCPGRGNVEILN